MSELDPFETRFAAAYRRYLAEAPVEADPVAVARRVAAAAPRRQGLAGFRPFGLTPAMAWTLLLAGLLAALAVGGLVAGSWRPDQAVVIAPSPTPTPTPGAGAPGQMTTPRGFHFATLLADGRVLIAGGSIGIMQGLASAELYDPSTGTFSSTGSMETLRGSLVATTLADGRVLITSGDDSKAEVYDPGTGTFKPTGSLKTPRSVPTATLLADGRVLVVGGLGASPNAPGDLVALTSAELYDPKKGTFSPTGSLKTAREGQTATLLADGRVLVAGGQGPSGALASAELYDPKTGTFHVTGSMTTAGGVTATALLDGRVLITGGGDGSKAEVYDPTTGTFKPTGSLKTPRWQQTATLLPDGRVLVAGGTDLNAGECCTPLTSAELYDPTKGTFSLTGLLTTARRGQTATLLADGRVLVAGGLGQQEVLASAELYDPATGTFGPTGP